MRFCHFEYIEPISIWFSECAAQKKIRRHFGIRKLGIPANALHLYHSGHDYKTIFYRSEHIITAFHLHMSMSTYLAITRQLVSINQLIAAICITINTSHMYRAEKIYGRHAIRIHLCTFYVVFAMKSSFAQRHSEFGVFSRRVNKISYSSELIKGMQMTLNWLTVVEK